MEKLDVNILMKLKKRDLVQLVLRTNAKCDKLMKLNADLFAALCKVTAKNALTNEVKADFKRRFDQLSQENPFDFEFVTPNADKIISELTGKKVTVKSKKDDQESVEETEKSTKEKVHKLDTDIPSFGKAVKKEKINDWVFLIENTIIDYIFIT